MIHFKKQLLVVSLLASSCLFVFAQAGNIQFNNGNVNVSGQGTIDGNPVRVNANTQTGQYGVSNGQGNGVQVNTNTGAWGVSGTINGNRIVVTSSGLSTVSGILNSNLSGPLQILALLQLIVARLVPFLIGVAIVAFFWFLIGMIWKGKDNPDEQQKMSKGMIWSVIAIFVMVSIWGLVAFIGNVTGIQQGGFMPGFNLPGERSR